jgi:uncharacterized repeat protein (TIGR02059 family)
MATNWTLTQSINQLLSGSPNNSTIDPIWSASNIRYSFADYYYQIARPNFESSFAPLGANARTVTRLNMELWDDLISRTISEVTPTTQLNYNSQKYEIALAHSTSPSYAYAYSPWNGGSSIWFNQNYTSGNTNLVSPKIGTHGFISYLHEIGHALVLNHMGDYNGSDNNGPSSIQDSTVFTIMSYYGPSWGNWVDYGMGVVEWADWIGNNGVLYSPQTPMLYDIYAIQKAYGADLHTRKTNTTYGFNSNISGIQSSIFDFKLNANPIITIYDAGGVDTLDFSGWSSNSYISLESATYSSVNYMTKNIWIAYGVQIENAIGGSGDDAIVGNSTNNVLDGRSGNDLLTGGAGNDTLIGGSGTDYACYAYNQANYSVTLISGEGSYKVTSNQEGVDTLSGIEYLRCLDGDYLISSLISVTDTFAPLFQGAATSEDGSKIILSYHEPLWSTVPAAKAFAITVAGKAVKISSVAAVGSTIELTLANTIKSTQVTTIAYAAPKSDAGTSNAAIQDTYGNDAVKFSSISVTNNSTLPEPDLIAPVLHIATAMEDGAHLVLFFSEILGAVTAPAKSFTVAIGKTKIDVANVAVSGPYVILDLASTIAQGQAVVVSYSAPKSSALTSNAAIQDESGNDAIKFSNFSVENLSTVPAPDTTAPVLQGAMTSGDGTQIALFFNETLGAVTAPTKSFTVAIGKTKIAVTNVSIGGSLVILDLASNIAEGQAVVVSYAAPKSSALTSNAAIQDESGNDAIKFSNFSVENLSTVPAPDTTAPVLQGAMTSGDGTQIALFFNETLGAVTAPTKSFTVAIGKTKIAVTNVSIGGSLVILDLASNIAEGQAVVVSYAAPKADLGTSNFAIQDTSGNDALKFSLVSVTNNSTYSSNYNSTLMDISNSEGIAPLETINDGDYLINVVGVQIQQTGTTSMLDSLYH